MNNPFQLTRAADLDDDQILKLWVDPSGDFGSRLRPSSPLPMIILGGRGSGKTHLLRYYSYQIQRRIHKPSQMLSVISKSGYIGIHSRCIGLNASRFYGKSLNTEQWKALFSYYMELWLGQMLLQTALLLLEDSGCIKEVDETKITQELCNLFDRPPILANYKISTFGEALRSLQREIDHLVNNASFRKTVDPQIEVSPGSLIFGIPKVLTQLIPELSGIMFTLFIDEYEHLYAEQQKHFNTLIRERENPVSFKIGVRPHGLKTHQTWGGNEELREGSDYELLNLDAELRKNEAAYELFAKRLCTSRIKFSLNGGLPEGWTEDNAIEKFEALFEKPQLPETAVISKLQARDTRSPWLINLENNIKKYGLTEASLGIKSELDLGIIVENLSCGENPLIEKTSCYLFYQAWSIRKNLIDASIEIGASSREYQLSPKKSNLHYRKLNHFKKDLIAQMLIDMDLKDFALTDYIGLSAWIRMSHGIARNLITLLKNVFDWALWKQELIFCDGGISVGSQTKGVSDTANWFLGDAKVLGEEAGLVSPAINRICLLMKELRFSEKIPECSLITFSVDFDSIDTVSNRVIKAAEQWSLLIRTSDRKERNTGAHVVSYRINGMISPDYLLPVSSRGNIHLNNAEVLAIFGQKEDIGFFDILKQRVTRCRPPFNKKKIDLSSTETDSGNELGLF